MLAAQLAHVAARVVCPQRFKKSKGHIGLQLPHRRRRCLEARSSRSLRRDRQRRLRRACSALDSTAAGAERTESAWWLSAWLSAPVRENSGRAEPNYINGSDWTAQKMQSRHGHWHRGFHQGRAAPLHRHFFVLNNGAWLETAKEKEEASPPHWSSRCLAAVQRQLWVLQRQLWVLQRQR